MPRPDADRWGCQVAPPPVGGRWWRLAGPVGVAAVGIASAGYVRAVDPSRPGHYPVCVFHAVTGWWCPGCGSLRAVHALTHGHLEQALGLNALTTTAIPLAVLVWGFWVRREITGRPLGWMPPNWLVYSGAAVVLAFWILRNMPGFGWLAP